MIKEIQTPTPQSLQMQELWPSVSIYVPTRPGFSNLDENRLKFKNALRSAKLMVDEIDRIKRERHNNVWLKHGLDLLNNIEFWKRQKNGLAVFLNKSTINTYRVGFVEELRIFVGVYFMFGPLLDVSSHRNSEYFVLALSQKSTRLFKLSDGSMSPVRPEFVSPSMKRALHVDELDKELQTHTVSSSGRKVSEAVHGHGYYKDRKKLLREKYLMLIAKRLKKVTSNTRVPVIVVGTSPIVSRFKEISKHSLVMHANILGNVDHLGPSELTKLLRAQKI